MKKPKSKFLKKMLDAGMPQAAIDKFVEDYANEPSRTILSLEVKADPYVDGTFALRMRKIWYHEYQYGGVLKRKKQFHTVDLLWYSGDFDEVEFFSWPPNARENNLQFFV